VFREIFTIVPIPPNSIHNAAMRSSALAATVALASAGLAAPMNSTYTNQTSSFADDPTAYMLGFRNASIQSSVGRQAICISGIVDVTASGNNVQISLQEPANQTDVTELVVGDVQINSTLSDQVVGGENRISESYGIYSQLCFPNGTINATTVQFLIHGVGFDRTYWNIAPNYSYVDYAAEQGYTTFFYDRLGVGLSDHQDPIETVQAELQVAIAHELIQLLRTGAIANQSFEHVVGVGHSFGSIQTAAITARFPDDLDAAVLTGFSASSTGVAIFSSGLDLTIASQNSPLRFADLSNGYLIANSIESNQFAFFRAPGFDQALLNTAEATKQTFSVGEILTQGSIDMRSTKFTGPIDVVDGENDLPFCQGNCLLPENQAAAVKDILYPAASNGSDYYIAEGAGHGLNLHYAAPKAYEHIQNFIMKNGL
jgi:pimeloyl-ACP methyl ester carboxylesterase